MKRKRPLKNKDYLIVKEAEIEQELAEMRQLAKDVAKAWCSKKTAVQLIDEQRRY